MFCVGLGGCGGGLGALRSYFKGSAPSTVVAGFCGTVNQLGRVDPFGTIVRTLDLPSLVEVAAAEGD